MVDPLFYIFNSSLKTGYFPQIWKEGIIVPIYKKYDKSNIRNYRPIIILNVIPKLFKSIFYDGMSSAFESIIIEQQHGFRRGRSTITNLCVYTQYLTAALESGMQVDAVYTDFSKAFDKVNHSVLLSKLEAYGVSGMTLQWLSSYLRDRTLVVKIKGQLSNKIFPTSGVPQGSHLGPLLFIIFINDIKNYIKSCEFICYADDLKLYREIKSIDDMLMLQDDLESLYDWSVINKLPLNFEKCETITFTKKRKTMNYYYNINGTVLFSNRK